MIPRRRLLVTVLAGYRSDRGTYPKRGPTDYTDGQARTGPGPRPRGRTVPTSIFLDFNLPNATTWFYLSALLAVALFFQFHRLLSLRNWDLVTLFMLVPGLLLLQDEQRGRGRRGRAASDRLWLGYLWLLVGSWYFFVRCVIDLALVRRPALHPNLNLAGLAWLTGTLFICLAGVAVRRPAEPEPQVGQGQRRTGGRPDGGRRPGDADGRRSHAGWGPTAATPGSGSSAGSPAPATWRSSSP